MGAKSMLREEMERAAGMAIQLISRMESWEIEGEISADGFCLVLMKHNGHWNVFCEREGKALTPIHTLPLPQRLRAMDALCDLYKVVSAEYLERLEYVASVSGRLRDALSSCEEIEKHGRAAPAQSAVQRDDAHSDPIMVVANDLSQ